MGGDLWRCKAERPSVIKDSRGQKGIMSWANSGSLQSFHHVYLHSLWRTWQFLPFRPQFGLLNGIGAGLHIATRFIFLFDCCWDLNPETQGSKAVCPSFLDWHSLSSGQGLFREWSKEYVGSGGPDLWGMDMCTVSGVEGPLVINFH